MKKILLSFTLGVLLTLASTLVADELFVRPSGAAGDLRMESKSLEELTAPFTISISIGSPCITDSVLF